ncbi:MAG: winged helix-turn-helix transcriptional regulator [Candidatus Methylomirabilales bacterium]
MKRGMDSQAQRNLKILGEVAKGEALSQRSLSRRAGIALGLTNLYLKRLVRKGYIKLVNVKKNRLLYLITPQGLAEKARLTREYMAYSLQLYREARLSLRACLDGLAESGIKRVVIVGTGEAAELAYLSLQEMGAEVVGVFDEEPCSSEFLGMRVRDLRELPTAHFDRVVVASFEPSEGKISTLEALGLSPDLITTLRLG